MPTALISVSDKTGLVNLARGLIQSGWHILASGGTARILRTANLPVEEIAEYTGSPEILDGRVKTLHPKIYAGILARELPDDQNQLEMIGARAIDLVVVNLYPFVEKVTQVDVEFEQAIESIDIGGVSLIRAAAKNFARVAVVTDPKDYLELLDEIQIQQQITLETRRRLAVAAFQHTARYDAEIQKYLSTQLLKKDASLMPELLNLYPVEQLRYGENPHQSAWLFGYDPDTGPLGGELLQGKALSYNNLLDLDAALRAAAMFERPTVVIVKHLSPCGIASADDLPAAFVQALASDPISAFGGVVVANRQIESDLIAEIGDLFVECLAAPGFSEDSLANLVEKKNLRVLKLKDQRVHPLVEYRSINYGILRQSVDLGDPIDVDGNPAHEWRVVTKREPRAEEWQSLRFAWKACQSVKSNAVVLVRGEATVGIGGGQPNRVDCVKLAGEKAGENADGAVMASDAFFPFSDSVITAAKLGVTAIIQPGGSIRDQESIDAANAHDIAMIFTGTRHFRH
jgi:phosphoribosylaminoimidazolecarboxamide formyltransferase/IMP cyclohydrolase